MKKNYSFLLLTILLLGSTRASFAQIVGGQAFLQGQYVEIGMVNNGSFGTSTAPAGYHGHAGFGTGLAEVYDYGHDGWTVGTPAYMGDYTLPGSPQEGWALQVNGQYNTAYQFGGYTGTGSLTGAITTYSSAGGQIIANWAGTASGGGLTVRQETRVDQFASWVTVTTYFKNTTAAPINNVYYMRTADPDNDETWPGGAFNTVNRIEYQNDASHRVMCSATGITGANAYFSLATKDCRAKAFIIGCGGGLTPTTNLADIYNQTGTASTYLYAGTQPTCPGYTQGGDVGFGIVYKLGNIAPGDSALISYAYIFKNTAAIDSAFPDPQIVVNGVPRPIVAPPTPNRDTFDVCLYPGLTTIPVNILNAIDRAWTWSHWTWSSGLGLATTTGLVNTINVNSLPPVYTYTITGTDSASGMQSCNNKVFYLTILTCNHAVSNSPCEGDSLVLNAPGDSTGATYQWYGPAPSTTVVGTTQRTVIYPATAAMEGDFTVVKTVGPTNDTSTTYVHIKHKPVVTASSNGSPCVALGGTLTLNAATDSGMIFAWTASPSSYTSSTQNPSMTATPADSGWYQVITTALNGCKDTDRTYVSIGPAPVVGPMSLCQYFTTTLVDVTPGGTWSSSTPSVATVDATGFINGLTGGVTTITYTIPNTCYRTAVVTVNPKPAPPSVPATRYCQYTLSGPLAAVGSNLLYYGLGVTPGSSLAPTPATAIPGTYNYYVTQTSAFGCVSDSTMYPVTIVPEPAPPVTVDTSYCQKTNAPALTATGSNLLWYANASSTPGSTTAPVPATVNVGTTTFYVSQTVNQCESHRAPLNVTVLYLPEFVINTNDWICRYDSMNLSYSGPALTQEGYHWILPDGAYFVNNTNENDKNVTVRFDSVKGNHYVYLTASDYNGRCATTDTFRVRVVDIPDATAFIQPNACLGDTINLAISNISSNAAAFTWTVDDISLQSTTALNIISHSSHSGGPFLVSWNNKGQHVIKISGFTVEGCKAIPTTDTVDVHMLPDATFKIAKTSDRLCIEDSVEFVANKQDYANKYDWQPAHFFDNINKPVMWGHVEQSNSLVTLTVTDPFGCEARYSQQINPDACCTVWFPNAFTPGATEHNKVFRPVFAGFHRFHTFRISNRWGQTVFESTSTDPQWNGTYNDIPQDMGTYYYYIKYDCGGKVIEQKGDVTLVR